MLSKGLAPTHRSDQNNPCFGGLMPGPGNPLRMETTPEMTMVFSPFRFQKFDIRIRIAFSINEWLDSSQVVYSKSKSILMARVPHRELRNLYVIGLVLHED